MRFAHIQNDRVREIFETENIDKFRKSFHRDIIKDCYECDDSVIVGNNYDKVTETFSEYIEPEPTQEELNFEYEENANKIKDDLLKLALKWIDSKLDPSNPEDVIFRQKFNEMKDELAKIK